MYNSNYYYFYHYYFYHYYCYHFYHYYCYHFYLQRQHGEAARRHVDRERDERGWLVAAAWYRGDDQVTLQAPPL